MKYLIALLLLCLAPMAQSSTITTATVTVTNTTANGNTLVINGATLTFTNAVALPASQIAVGTNIVSSATNIFLARSASRSANLDVYTSSTNVVIFRSYPGQTLTVALTGTWGTIGLSTNNVGDATMIRAPYAAVGNYERTNSASTIVDYLNSNKSTNIIDDSITALGGYVNASQIQTIAGKKTFLGANIYQSDAQVFNGGTITNALLTNSAYSGNIGKLTNGVLYNPSITNGTLGGTIQNDDTVGGFTPLKIIVSGEDEFNFRRWGTDKDVNTVIRFGDFDTSTFTFDPLGTGSIGVKMKGSAALFGQTSSGTNLFTGQVEFARKDITTLANGNNNIDASTNLYLKVSGPTGVFAITGIAGGRDGRLIKIQNSTGFTITIANDSGVGASGNRIYTGSGSDYANANNPGMVTLIYDSATSHWVIDSHN